ncbi:hypothetical protein [Chryseobacterium sp. JM1]|uniref:hypothetical protein n=1 Tax=Chryseobacterium sp. JM1 TaxID=1233950 RepID=UPI0004E76AA6|nr:hypothetical protein [Chryseobacterium sp. JM1]KFF22935.1 hypothetical protein IW22_01430 [Chryseobacterium sp. JM1]
MKNILVRSLVVFIVMSLLNAQFCEWTLQFLKVKSDGTAMVPMGVLIECLIVTVVSFITVLVFRKNYHSMVRMAVLFEIIYLLTLLISGTNPIKYFSDQGDAEFLALFIYVNSFVVFLVICLFNLMYSKIITPKLKTNIHQDENE